MFKVRVKGTNQFISIKKAYGHYKMISLSSEDRAESFYDKIEFLNQIHEIIKEVYRNVAAKGRTAYGSNNSIPITYQLEIVDESGLFYEIDIEHEKRKAIAFSFNPAISDWVNGNVKSGYYITLKENDDSSDLVTFLSFNKVKFVESKDKLVLFKLKSKPGNILKIEESEGLLNEINERYCSKYLIKPVKLRK